MRAAGFPPKTHELGSRAAWWCALVCAGLLACGPGERESRAPTQIGVGSVEGAARTAVPGEREEGERKSAPAAVREDAREAQRIVSLAPSLTRMLIEVGAAGAIVGVDAFSAELPRVRQATVLGGLFAPDLERLVELRPSLVVGVQSAQQQALFEQLRARGTRVETFRLHSLDQVLAALEAIGTLAGDAEAGRELAEKVRRELAQIAASVGSRPRPRVALVIEREPLFVVGSGSFAHALIEAAGGENVFADLDSAYPRVSLEALAARAPDVLLETTEPTLEARLAAEQYWSQFRFVRDVETLPRGEVVLPSPELARGARLLRDALHPELAEALRSSAQDGASP